MERANALRLCGRPDEADDALASAARDAVSSKRIRARVECERAHVRLSAGDLSLDEAVGTLVQEMANLQAAGDTRGLARAEISLGSVHWLACRYEEFAAAAERAEQHYAASGFSPSRCIAIQAEALYYGAVPVAEALLRCGDLLERSPDRAAEPAVTSVLGGLRGLEGNCDDGRMLLAHALSLYEEVGNQSALLTTWSSLFTDIESIAGNHAAAEAEARSSVEALHVTEVLRMPARGRCNWRTCCSTAATQTPRSPGWTWRRRKRLRRTSSCSSGRRSARARILARRGDLEEGGRGWVGMP